MNVNDYTIDFVDINNYSKTLACTLTKSHILALLLERTEANLRAFQVYWKS